MASFNGVEQRMARGEEVNKKMDKKPGEWRRRIIRDISYNIFVAAPEEL